MLPPRAPMILHKNSQIAEGKQLNRYKWDRPLMRSSALSPYRSVFCSTLAIILHSHGTKSRYIWHFFLFLWFAIAPPPLRCECNKSLGLSDYVTSKLLHRFAFFNNSHSRVRITIFSNFHFFFLSLALCLVDLMRLTHIVYLIWPTKRNKREPNNNNKKKTEIGNRLKANSINNIHRFKA